jgi:hypothetical protein
MVPGFETFNGVPFLDMTSNVLREPAQAISDTALELVAAQFRALGLVP